jgi:hypothetical protein
MMMIIIIIIMCAPPLKNTDNHPTCVIKRQLVLYLHSDVPWKEAAYQIHVSIPRQSTNRCDSTTRSDLPLDSLVTDVPVINSLYFICLFIWHLANYHTVWDTSQHFAASKMNTHYLPISRRMVKLHPPPSYITSKHNAGLLVCIRTGIPHQLIHSAWRRPNF